eukprot:TRINITY_DN57531_c0_g1_i1.p1 TRINITY_DN57531_c0_g1~~TRINITY_DN57531_c0_g1_i1.p1  ORF type:complete len:977 (-),score=183.99 TRINITY_DN57531_c0_g1_i1:181-3111(-)
MADSDELPQGALVILEGLNKSLVPLGREDAGALDFNGAQAQVVENDEELGLLVVTFTGYFLQVSPSYCRLLTASELEGLDLVLGPASNPEGLAEQMPGLLLEKGYVTTQVVLPPETRASIMGAVKRLDEDGHFARLPACFEVGYLGKEPAPDRVALLEAVEAALPEEVELSGLLSQDKSLNEHLKLLRPRLFETLGIQLASRTNLLLRLAGREPDPEQEETRAPATGEADAFLSLMGRRRLCLLRFLGPSSGQLRLMPRAGDGEEVTMAAVPDLQVIFLTEQYDFRFEADGECLVLQSFFLEQPMQWMFQGDAGSALNLAELDDTVSIPGPPPPASQIVVKGMASRDPCEADMHEKLWAAVRHGGCDGSLEIPKTRFDTDAYVDYEDQQRAIASFKSYCRHQGHIEGIEIFDADFFNIATQEVRGMDPEQRILMETGWMALSDVGYNRTTLRTDSAHLGVFVGISGSDWRDVCQAASANGIPETFIANRFSYAINLKGPSFIVNTACSASLVALHSAKTHMRMEHDALDGCLVAGISLNTSPGTWIGNCAGGMLSFGGRCFSFNNTADGYARGEGCAAGVIGRGTYSKDDESICAVLAASNTNSDGRSASLTAPNGPAQQRLLRSILSESRLQPVEIDVYEAHGTGTSLGDPIEISAVRKVINREHPIMVSCSKGNLGHLEGGAGMSSFCKCVMACMHAEAAPNQHYRVQNPNLDIEGWPALILQEAQTLRGQGSFVGVSGFGYGGTNSHALAYAQNVVTSRGSNPKYALDRVIRKVKGGPPPTVTMLGDNFEEWSTTGLHHVKARAGKQFQIHLQKNGKVIFREAMGMQPSASSMQIQGSFSNWSPVEMESSPDRASLFTYELTLGASGEESFQVLVDGLRSQVLQPPEKNCTNRASTVRGPAAATDQELSWVVKGERGSRHRVEVFMPQRGVISVTWFKQGGSSQMPKEERPQLTAPPQPSIPDIAVDDYSIQE